MQRQEMAGVRRLRLAAVVAGVAHVVLYVVRLDAFTIFTTALIVIFAARSAKVDGWVRGRSNLPLDGDR